MYRLLIVDDEPPIVEGLVEMVELQELPFKEIRMAYSAKEALALFAEEAFDIVLADIRMPNMNGLELMDAVKGIYQETKFIFLSGYSDFNYARQAMKLGASDYLLKPAEDEEVVGCLNRVLSEVELRMEQLMLLELAQKRSKALLLNDQAEFLKRMLMNEQQNKFVEPTELQAAFVRLELPFDGNQEVFLAVVRVDEWSDRFVQSDEALVQFTVQNVINDILQDSTRIACFIMEDGLIAITLQPNAERSHLKQNYQAMLEEAQDAIDRILGVVISVAIMVQPLTWEKWAEKLRNLIISMKQSLGKGRMIIQQQKPREHEYGEANQQIRFIIHAINLREMDTFEQGMERLLLENETESKDNSHKTAVLFMSISMHIMNLALQYGVASILSQLEIDKLTNLYSHKNAHSFKQFLSQTLSKVYKQLDLNALNPSESLVEQIKMYIDGNLKEDLSLHALSKKIHVNPSYLSRIFSQITKEQLSLYINGKRMGLAKQLLASGNLKVHEVAIQVGFENPNYFAKVFRKAIGIAPQDYRISQTPR